MFKNEYCNYVGFAAFEIYPAGVGMCIKIYIRIVMHDNKLIRAIYANLHALQFIIAGATTVGVGTALFYDPLVCKKINDGIARYLERYKYQKVSELIGSIHISADELDEAASG